MYANQVVTRTHANQGHLCKPSRDGDSRKPRALLCKPSRDRDSRKPRAFYANRTDIYGNRILGLYGIAQDIGRKKEQSEKTDKDKTTDKNSADNRKAYQVTPTLALHTSPKRRSTDPSLPPPLAPHPRHRISTVSSHAVTSQAKRKLGDHSACSSHAGHTCCSYWQ